MAMTKLMTAEDLAQIEDDGFRYNLLQGELHRMAPAGGRHGEVGGVFAAHLGVFMLEHRSGRLYVAETGFLLARDPDILLVPNLAFVRAERLPPEEARLGYLPLAPDLAVEIVSPSNRPRLVEDKVAAYLDAGVPLVVVVYPEHRTVTVHIPGQEPRELVEGDELTGGEALPGFRLAVSELFQ